MKQIRLMIVGHDKELLRKITNISSKCGYKVLDFDSETVALENLASIRPDVIILDLNNSSENEFLDKLSGDSNTKLIVLRHSESRQDIKKVRRLGSTHVLVKRWMKPSQLLHIIQSLNQNS